MERLTFTNTIKREKPAPHKRAYMVNQVLEFMSDSNFGKWLGLTKHLTPDQIYVMIQESKGGDNPQGLFWWLLKRSRK